MTTSPAKKTSASSKRIAHEHIARLDGAALDPDSGLYIGTITIGRQLLRVGIRPPVVPDEERGHKHPLMLFNGIGGNMEVSAPFLSELVHTEAVIFDIPGTGGSPPRRLPYRFVSMARLAAKLLDKLGYEKIDVIGVSWGGRTGTAICNAISKKGAATGIGRYHYGRHRNATGQPQNPAQDGKPATLSRGGLHEEHRR